MGDAFVSVSVSNVGSEATVRSAWDERALLVLYKGDSGELCVSCPLKGQ